jgi:hypothetical protein
VKKKETPRDRYKKVVGSLKYDRRQELEPVDEEAEAAYHNSKLSKKYTEDAPYVIAREDYDDEDMSHYDKLTIYYYEDDDTLTDENEEVIADVDSIVGGDSLTRFGDLSGDPEVVYVRNDKLQIDYEIIRLSKSYGETIGFERG